MVDGDRIINLFNDALECEPQERENFLAQACPRNPALKEIIRSLLVSDNNAKDFLREPAAKISVADIALQALDLEKDATIGKLFGSYRIEKEIGRGGMGKVYLATRDDHVYNKQVAIKVLRLSRDSESVIRRFQNERQILADLEHPNIARLIDGGTTDESFPYLVMEYIDGLPVDQYCNSAHLSIDERLTLFRKICAAVEFAHEHQIIHRDIKPSNILVTNAGIPKLLDFGIAKMPPNDGKVTTTATSLRGMTPEYASPEQMRGEKVGVGSDIYSLGLLLYELITGRRPHNFHGKSPYEVVRAICNEEPLAPSAAFSTTQEHTRAIKAENTSGRSTRPRGFRRMTDLDNIVLKSLRKEPERRFKSVKEFSEDLRRYLAGLPITAREDTLFYRSSRFIRRNRTAAFSALGAGMLVLVVVIFLNFVGRRGEAASSDFALPTGSADQKVMAESQKCGTENAEAYNLYLRGKHLWNQRKVETHWQAAESFKQAIEKDPNYALAYSGLSTSYSLLSVWAAISPREAFPLARNAAERAISICPDSAEGHLSLAIVFWLYEWDWDGADREFKMAVELDSNYTLAPHWYGLFLAEMGRFEEAIAFEKRALEIEPLSGPINADLARVFFYARRYEEAKEQYEKTIEINPNAGGYFGELAEFYEAAGMSKEWYHLIARLFHGRMPIALKRAFRTDGIRGFRKKALELSPASFDGAWDYHFSPANTSTGTKDKREALELLDRAFAVRDHRMAQLKVSPRFDYLRNEPLFQELLGRMNFVP